MNINSKIIKLPDSSGVYFFKDKNGKIIYIGKANSLIKRVSSYFKESTKLLPKIRKMTSEINDIEYISTKSEIEALITERKMIKEHHPYYNTMLKDDKSFPYIRITIGLDFPQIFFYRKTKKDLENDQSIYFGPFTDSDATRTVIKVIRQIFKIRGCKKKNLRKEDICLDYQIGLCSAPCAKLIEKEEYRKMTKEACLFLNGKQKRLLNDLYREMRILSKKLDFEKAAKIRDKIQSIKDIIKGQEIIFFNRNEAINYELTKIDEKEKSDIIEGQRAIVDLKQKLCLEKIPRMIEAFDISNIQGELSVGSMVQFNNGRPQKRGYRRFKIRSVEQPDDYAMMQEVIMRRYSKLIADKEQTPDLILVDGGKGQLSSAWKALKDLKLDIKIISIAKKEEEIYQLESSQSIKLPAGSRALFLLQRVRDEAHRFAVNYHRKLRGKILRQSKLDFIPGIGMKRKKQLLITYKSIAEIKNASIEELSQVPGIGIKIAGIIKTVLEVK